MFRNKPYSVVPVITLFLVGFFLPQAVFALTETEVDKGQNYVIYSNGNDIDVTIGNDIDTGISPGAEAGANQPGDRVFIRTQNVIEKTDMGGNGVNAFALAADSKTELNINGSVSAENRLETIGVYTRSQDEGTANVTVNRNVTAESDESAFSIKIEAEQGNSTVSVEEDVAAAVTAENGSDETYAAGIDISAEKGNVLMNLSGDLTVSASAQAEGDQYISANAAGIMASAINEGSAGVIADGNVSARASAKSNGSADAAPRENTGKALRGNSDANPMGNAAVSVNAEHKGISEVFITKDVNAAADAESNEKASASFFGIIVVSGDEGSGNAAVGGSIRVKASAKGEEQAAASAKGIFINTFDAGSGMATTAGDVIVNAATISNGTNFAEAEGISLAAENGSAVVTVDGDVIVTAEAAGRASVTGINLFAENNSDPQITVHGDVVVRSEAESKQNHGITVMVHSESKATVIVEGDVISDSVGISVDADEKSKIDAAVFGTIHAKEAGIQVGENVSAENFDLTVWKIEPNSGGCAAVKADGSCAEDVEAAIKYIIKADGSPDDGKLTDQYGKPLERSHGFPVAKAGDTVCFHSGAQGTGNCVTVSKGGGVSFTAESGHSIDFYRILDRNGKLPATGFSAQSAVSPALRPRELAYGSTGLTLQIPALDLMETIVSVPKTDGAYPVDRLGSEIGLLDGSALPGEGFSVLTGHNHLNSTEAGPFLFLRELTENDLILVSDDSGNIQRFHVSGNYLIAPDELDTLADVLTENTLMLLTCEDEAVEGGYLHRRVILAEERIQQDFH